MIVSVSIDDDIHRHPEKSFDYLPCIPPIVKVMKDSDLKPLDFQDLRWLYAGIIQPIIVAPQGQVAFWCGILEPTSEAISASYGRLNKSSSTQVFPIQFASEVELAAGPLKGSIAGFLMLKKIGARDVRVFV